MKKIYDCFPFVLFMIIASSCSHKYNADTLGLEFYQWNLWEDSDANPGDELPSCGWEELHRGKGQLVRIPASIEEHFPENTGREIYWYHCRFSLPGQWEDQPISLIFKEAGPSLIVYLNEQRVGSFQGEEGAFELDVSETIYYTRDNHLDIRISNEVGFTPETLMGITGTILVKPHTGANEIKESTE